MLVCIAAYNIWQAYTQSKILFIVKDRDRNWMYLKKRTIVFGDSKSVPVWMCLHRVWEALAVGSEMVERKLWWFSICRNYNKCKKCNQDVFSQCFLHRDREFSTKAEAALGIRADIFQVWRQMFIRMGYLRGFHSLWLHHRQLNTANPWNRSLHNQWCHSTVRQLTMTGRSWDVLSK